MNAADYAIYDEIQALCDHIEGFFVVDEDVDPDWLMCGWCGMCTMRAMLEAGDIRGSLEPEPTPGEQP